MLRSGCIGRGSENRCASKTLLICGLAAHLHKFAAKARLKKMLKTRKAHTVAANMFNKLRQKCKEVVQKKGAAIRS